MRRVPELTKDDGGVLHYEMVGPGNAQALLLIGGPRHTHVGWRDEFIRLFVDAVNTDARGPHSPGAGLIARTREEVRHGARRSSNRRSFRCLLKRYSRGRLNSGASIEVRFANLAAE